MYQVWSVAIELHTSRGMHEYIGYLWAAGLQWHLAKFGLQERAQSCFDVAAATWNVYYYARACHHNNPGFNSPLVDALVVVQRWAICTYSTGSNFLI